MTKPSDISAIEARIALERAALASTLDSLKDRTFADHLAQEALGLVASGAASYSRSIGNAARANPLAFALAGAGIAWIILGSGKASTSRHTAEQGNGMETDSGPDIALRVSIAALQEAMGDDWLAEIDVLRDKANTMLRHIEREARQQARNLGPGIAQNAEKARDYAAERTQVLADFAETLQQSFRQGLDGLSDTMRDQIIAAREQTYASRIRAEKAVRKGTDQALGWIEENPMTAGAIALAIGAAFAATLPRTHAEDEPLRNGKDRRKDGAR